jgi:signal transduction histidine kinase
MVTVTLGLVGLVVVNRLGAYFDEQQEEDLAARALGVAQYVIFVAESTDTVLAGHPVVSSAGIVDRSVLAELSRDRQKQIITDQLARADVRIRIGLVTNGFHPSPNGIFEDRLQVQEQPGQLQEAMTSTPIVVPVTSAAIPYGVEVTLLNPFTDRAIAISNVSGLLAVIGLIALSVAIIFAATLARRITTPLRRLTEASRDLAEGDFARRVPEETMEDGPAELAELGHQFNAMAERLQESIEIIRRDRDRSREFLADVSHELRTPIAALRTFNELLTEGAADDPTTRAEFLETSRAQLERLDWLAQNLLELSKLDSGLVLLDLRPDDLRAAVESAVEQNRAAAERRGVIVSLHLPDAPIRIRHDPPRVGQVVANLVANAIKFTGRGGSVSVDVAATPEGAWIEVTDTGVGIDPAELPHIFERFYRGSRANEARGSGSGLGLAIVRSIVDMHGGTVEVESRVGQGTRFVVTLPRDPRLVEGTPAAEQAAVASAAEARARPDGSVPRPAGVPGPSEAQIANVQETSP